MAIGSSRLPVFPVPEGNTAEQFIRDESAAGLAARFAEKVDVAGGAGNGTITGSVSNGGTFKPGGDGTAGKITVTGAYTQTSAGTLNIDFGGTSAGTTFDQLAVTGSARMRSTTGSTTAPR